MKTNVNEGATHATTGYCDSGNHVVPPYQGHHGEIVPPIEGYPYYWYIPDSTELQTKIKDLEAENKRLKEAILKLIGE